MWLSSPLERARSGVRECLGLLRHTYPRRHALELQINGQRWGWQTFELVFES
jgi:hypothetical protein